MSLASIACTSAVRLVWLLSTLLASWSSFSHSSSQLSSFSFLGLRRGAAAAGFAGTGFVAAGWAAAGSAAAGVGLGEAAGRCARKVSSNCSSVVPAVPAAPDAPAAPPAAPPAALAAASACP
eukprot:scaffold22622_cov63-Phaeocystis_antarctica.AAC.1